MAIGVTVMVVIAVPVTVALPPFPVVPVAFTVVPAAVAMLPPGAAPIGTVIGWPHPASWIPDIAAFIGSPVALRPNVTHFRRRRSYLITYGWRRRADSDTN